MAWRSHGPGIPEALALTCQLNDGYKLEASACLPGLELVQMKLEWDLKGCLSADEHQVCLLSGATPRQSA